MIRSLAILIAAVFVVLLACPTTSQAQYYGGYGYSGYSSVNGPTVSPYLNLLQQNQFGLPTYQTLVRPQIEARNAIVRQERSLQQLQQEVQQGRSSQFRSRNSGTNRRFTGHQTFFSNTLQYYNRNEIRPAISALR